MSRSEKLLQRLRSIPADFTWGELTAALKGVGYKDISDIPGSSRTFIHTSGNKIKLHKPHPTNILKKYALRQIVEHLDALGL